MDQSIIKKGVDPVSIVAILEDFKILEQYINAEVERRMKTAQEPRYCSESIHELACALACAQGEFVPIPYNRTNASWNDDYTDLDIVFKYVRPIMAKNGLSISQWTELTADGGTILHTELLHSSGQWKESRIKVVPSRNDIKCFDSIMADYRRQQAIGLLGVTLLGDPIDDDGQIEMHVGYEEVASGAETKLIRTKESFDCITKTQLEELEMELNGFPDLAAELLNKYRLRVLIDMPASRFRFAIEQVRKFKLYRQEKRPLNQ